jgi:hypothetical protein
MASNSKSPLHPTALTSTTLPGFLQNLLENHIAPTKLIVCASETTFIRQLHASTEAEKAQQAQEADAEAEGLDPAKAQRIASSIHPLAIPTIHQIFTTRTVNVTFCETLAQLQAYLSVYGIRNSEIGYDTGNSNHRQDGGNDVPILGLLCAIQLHRGTASFSAQGLSRTLASAVEAAHRAGQKLVLIEYPSMLLPPEAGEDEDKDEDMFDDGRTNLEEDLTPGQEKSIWEEQLAILNVTTKSFGAGERGWVGRTVKVRKVVGRWCEFK